MRDLMKQKQNAILNVRDKFIIIFNNLILLLLINLEFQILTFQLIGINWHLISNRQSIEEL